MPFISCHALKSRLNFKTDCMRICVLQIIWRRSSNETTFCSHHRSTFVVNMRLGGLFLSVCVFCLPVTVTNSVFLSTSIYFSTVQSYRLCLEERRRMEIVRWWPCHFMHDFCLRWLKIKRSKAGFKTLKHGQVLPMWPWQKHSNSTVPGKVLTTK